jgi:hypothetical protein
MYLSPHELDLGASTLVDRLLPRFDLGRVVARRRRNFERLASQLRDRVRIHGDPLPPGACPLFVPIRVRDKGSLLRALRARGIDAIDFWGIGDPACPEEQFPEVQALRREVLEPCRDPESLLARRARGSLSGRQSLRLVQTGTETPVREAVPIVR